MPSHISGTFASAAARIPSDDHSLHGRTSRGEGSGDWSRPRPNGVGTATFRRQSHASNTVQPSSQPPSTQSNGTGAYIPPHQQQANLNRGPQSAESRFSKDHLLRIFNAQKESGVLGKNISSLYVDGWEPKLMDGTRGAALADGDDRRRDPTQSGSSLCWDGNGSTVPLGLTDMTNEEHDLFSSSVNSPLKAPAHAAGKDPATLSNGPNNRKTSGNYPTMSNGPYGLSSPTSIRPGTRRRETSDSIANVSSPNGVGRSSKDETKHPTSPPLLLRRRTDFRDISSGSAGSDQRPEATRDVPADMASGFGDFIRRSATGPLSAGGNNPSTPWSAAASGLPPMGSFGNFGMSEPTGQATAPLDKRPGTGSVRGGSRWSKYMARDGADEAGPALKDKTSRTSLEKLVEDQTGQPSQGWEGARVNRPLSDDTDPYGDAQELTGAPGDGASSTANATYGQQRHDFGGVSHGAAGEGFHAMDVGMSSAFGAPGRPQPRDIRGPPQDTPAREPLSPTETNPYQSPATERADSDDVDTDSSEIRNTHHPGLSGLAAEPRADNIGPMPMGFPQGFDGTAGDRSQSSSAGPSRGFSNLGGIAGMNGLGGLNGWVNNPGPIGTPDRERNLTTGLNTSFLNAIGTELQSPSLASGGNGGGLFGSGAGPTSGGTGTAGRASKLGSLFPPAMQAQMYGNKGQGEEGRLPGGNDGQRPQSGSDPNRRNPFETFRQAQGPPSTDQDSASRSSRGMFEEPGSDPQNRAPTAAEHPAGAFGHPSATSLNPASTSGSTSSQAASQAGQASNQNAPTSQPPNMQQRTMVMPDRMRWIYQDPQGSTQGPWSGLEMHDWFKAGFFTAELLVKKQEDQDFEPLGQMIRRIGNSREPFLVPQIGIPHGPAAPEPSTPWSATAPAPTPTQNTGQAGSVQPPFAGAFPSFGTTLTAEQQNALERRKQEEQFLMARQKEYLAQQQVLQKQMHQMPGGAQQLHHHSSAHSLQSQPSFGSISSPNTFAQPALPGQMPAQGGMPGLFDPQLRSGAPPSGPAGPTSAYPGAGVMREEDLAAMMARQNLGRDGQEHGTPGAFAFSHQQNQGHPPHVAAMMAQRAQLEREQAQHDAMQQARSNGPSEGNERLDQFNELRAQRDFEQMSQPPEGVIGKPVGYQGDLGEARDGQKQQQAPQYRTGFPMEDLLPQAQRPGPSTDGPKANQSQEPLSLTQQVQRAASAKHSPLPAAQPDNAWGVDKMGLPQPFPPPPQSVSPLPAPAARRSRQNLPEALNAESPRPQSPAADITPVAPSVAPWAKDNNEGSRGPSLKEIQAAEAKKAAKLEESAAAARRSAMESERQNQIHVPAPAPGLPTTSTWGSSNSPVSASVASPSAWTKPAVGKATSGPGPAGTKKTLSQIQKEEETRKQKLAAASGVMAGIVPTGAGQATAAGKRYADLASKAAAVPQIPSASGPWMTVGASGKAKTPANTAPPVPVPGVRAASSAAVPTLSSTGSKPKPVMTPTRSTTMGAPLPGQQTARDEFTKWAKSALAKGLNSNINVDDFVQQLLTFPPEAEIISESVYANSQTMDGRRFAEEFLRRRKMADKGVFEAVASGTSNGVSPSGGADAKAGASGNGGWNEVAKKGPQGGSKEDTNSAFKIVAGKKKGRK
ncbi:MAG: hypothetical protein M1817_003326 [Caeruleum heppii]|nr:MAG: hypothetical protein M1817_003326 [Caeruleum heppii]